MRAAARLVLGVGGVGYDLCVPLMARFAEDERLRVYVHLVVREDAHTLYGFPDVDTRDLFRTLLGVRGVGPAMALGILSSLPGDELVAAIQAEDAQRLCSVKGVGKKTAQQILLDLRDKIAAFSTRDLVAGKGAVPAALHGNHADAVAALLSIGFKEKDAEKAVMKATAEVGEDDLDTLIRTALSLR
jgi:Holliday junction DNA helicase RuvA